MPWTISHDQRKEAPGEQKTENHDLTWIVHEARSVQLATVELQANDGEHEDGKEEQKANLQKRHHGLHDGLQHDLQA